MHARRLRHQLPTPISDGPDPRDGESGVQAVGVSHSGGARRRRGGTAWLARYRRLNLMGSSGLLATTTLRKWLPIASLIGLVAGLRAIEFFAAIQWCTAFFQGTLLGYVAPSPLGEGTAQPTE